jgi:hypothetical protein
MTSRAFPKRQHLITEQNCGDPMLSKCANPNCETTFRYFHEGRLYLIDPREALAGYKPGCSSKSAQLEYVWLCSSCSLYLTIQIDQELGTRVVRKFEAKFGAKSEAKFEGKFQTKNGSGSGASGDDNPHTDIA